MRLLSLVLGLAACCVALPGASQGGGLSLPGAAQVTPPELSSPFSPVLEVEVRGRPREVWAALTEPDQLSRWFCRTAEINCTVGGLFRWSDDVIDLEKERRRELRIRERIRQEGLTPEQATRLRGPDPWTRVRVVTVRPFQRLEYDWSWEKIPTRVSWELTPVAGAPRADPRTLVRVSHLIVGQAPRRDYLFREPLLYLREFLADGEVNYRYEDELRVSEDGTGELKMRVESSPEWVWTLLTAAKEMSRYQSGGTPFADLRPGGRITYAWGETGIIRDLKRWELLAHTWLGFDGTVTWRLHRKGKQETEVVFTQTGVKPRQGGTREGQRRMILWSRLLHRLRFVAETNSSLDLPPGIVSSK